MSGKSFEHIENRRLAADPQYVRRLRVCIVASHEYENRCVQHIVELLLNVVWWQHLPKVNWDRRFRCVAFRMLSKMLCAVEELLVHPASQMPLPLFLVLLDMGDVCTSM